MTAQSRNVTVSAEALSALMSRLRIVRWLKARFSPPMLCWNSSGAGGFQKRS